MHSRGRATCQGTCNVKKRLLPDLGYVSAFSLMCFACIKSGIYLLLSDALVLLIFSMLLCFKLFINERTKRLIHLLLKVLIKDVKISSQTYFFFFNCLYEVYRYISRVSGGTWTEKGTC